MFLDDFELKTYVEELDFLVFTPFTLTPALPSTSPLGYERKLHPCGDVLNKTRS